MRDMNLNSGCGWPLFCENNGMKGISNYCFSWTNEYDGKLLRQTILRHEEIFRKQVCELHRLYRVQQLCMDEQRRRGEKSLPLNLHSSPLIPVANGFHFNNDDHDRTTSSKSGSLTRKTEDYRMVNALTEAKTKNSPKKVFDLHLPAEAYIDEDAEEEQFTEKQDSEETKILACTCTHENSAEFRQNVQVRPSCLLLADLNEPVEEFEEDDNSSSVVGVHCEDLQKHEASKCGSVFSSIRGDCKAKDLNLFQGIREHKGRDRLDFGDLARPSSNPVQAHDPSSVFQHSAQTRVLRGVDINLLPDDIFMPRKENHQKLGFQQDQEEPVLAEVIQEEILVPRTEKHQKMGFEQDRELIVQKLELEKLVQEEIVVLRRENHKKLGLGHDREKLDLVEAGQEEFPTDRRENSQTSVFEQDQDEFALEEKMAAEAIQAMAAAAKEEVAGMALAWLAEAVTCADPFEVAALALESVAVVAMDEEKTAAAAVAVATVVGDEDERRGRRGGQRRRRNFRRDVLPGMGTLTRQEVAEDLQILEAMARVGGEQRKAGRRGVGARRRRELLAWGRTTRRCWRQKCLSGSLAHEMVFAMDG
ncbi:uncharacterized protein LOC144707537 isoform X2 [Wolffia australiana]